MALTPIGRPDYKNAPEFLPTQAAVIRFWDITKKTAASWQKMDGFPLKTSEGFNVSAIDDWLEGRGAYGEPMNLTDARLEKVKLECRKLEIAIQKEQGEMVETAEVERRWTAIGQSIQTKLKRRNQHLAKVLLGCESAGEVVKVLDGSDRELLHAVAIGD